MAKAFPRSRIQLIDDAMLFVSVDAKATVAAAIADFAPLHRAL